MEGRVKEVRRRSRVLRATLVVIAVVQHRFHAREEDGAGGLVEGPTGAMGFVSVSCFGTGSSSDSAAGADVESSEVDSSAPSLEELSLEPAIRFIASSSRSSPTSVRLLFLPPFVGASWCSSSGSSTWPFVCSGLSATSLLFKLVERSDGRTGPAYPI